MIRKILTITILTISFAFVVNGQVTLTTKEYDKLKEEAANYKKCSKNNKTLEKENKKLQKDIEGLNAKLADLQKKMEGSSAKIGNVKDLKKEIELLKKDTATKSKTIKTLNQKLAKQDAEIKKFSSSKTECEKLKKDVKSLQMKSSTDALKINDQKKEIEEWKTKCSDYALVVAEKDGLKKDTAALKKTIASKEQEISNLSVEKGELRKQNTQLNNQVANLTQDVTKKSNEIASLNSQLTAKKNEIAAFAPVKQKKDDLQRALKANLQYAVGYITKSKDFNIAKTDELIQNCKTKYSTLIDKNTVNSYILQLENYKGRAEVYNQAKMLLSQKYSKANIATHITRLNLAQAKLSGDASLECGNLIQILKNYKEYNNKAYVYYQKADIYKDSDERKVKQILREGINKIPHSYKYLIQQLNKKVGYTSYQCKLTKEK